MILLSNEEQRTLKAFNSDNLPIVAMNTTWLPMSGLRYHTSDYNQNSGKMKLKDDEAFKKYIKKKYREKRVCLVIRTPTTITMTTGKVIKETENILADDSRAETNNT